MINPEIITLVNEDSVAIDHTVRIVILITCATDKSFGGSKTSDCLIQKKKQK